MTTTPIKPAILAPADSFDEIELLAEAGAEELYGGVQPDEERWTRVSSNQRTFAGAQFASTDEFARAAQRAKELGLKLHLVLNSPLYDPARADELIELAEMSCDWGISGLIVGDLGLLAKLGSLDLEMELTLSTMAGAVNREVVNFYSRFVDRAVLPRHLTIPEITSIVKSQPSIKFEVFVLVGKCQNVEAFCTFQHTSPNKRWPCEVPYELSTVEGSNLSPAHPFAQHQLEWAKADRRMACGLCGVPALVQTGISHLKIVGRGGPSHGKAANVRLVRKVLDEQLTVEETMTLYRERFGRDCNAHTCYFPEFFKNL